MKIGTKLLTLTLVISLVPIIAISVFSITRSQGAIKESVGRDLRHLAKEKADSIVLIFESRVAEAKMLAASRELREALRESNRRYRGRTEEDILGSINFIDEEWISSDRRSVRADEILESDLSRYLKEYQQIDPAQSGELFVTDRLGATVAMTGRLSDYYQADEQWWQRAFDGGLGKVVIDDRGYDESVQALTVGVVVPVRDNGEVIGILKVNNKIGRVMEIIHTLPFGNEGHILLARSEGGVLAHSKGSTLETRNAVTPVEAGIMMGKGGSGWTVDEHGGGRRIEGYSSVDIELIVRVPAEGERRGISGEKWVPARWFVFVELDESVAFAGILSLKRALLVFCSLTGLVVVILTVISARSISKPVDRLTSGVKEIGSGGLGEVRVGTGSSDEVGQLSRAFDKMCDDLEKVTASRDELDREISERKKTEEVLKYRIRFEELIISISSQLIEVEADRIDEGIEHALETIGGFSGVDRSYLFLFSDNLRTMDNTHEWCAQGIEEQKHRLKGVRCEDFPWIMAKYRRFETVHIPSVSSLPSEAHSERDEFRREGIQSLLTVPLVYRGDLVGFLGFDSVRVEKTWADETIALLKVVGDIFVNSIMRKKAEDETERMQAALLHSQKMEAIGRLAGGIAHDFNNMMVAVHGLSLLGKKKVDKSDPLHTYFDNIHRASERAIALTRQLSFMSRKRETVLAPTNLSDVLGELLKILPPLIGEDIRILTDLEPRLWTALADAGNLEQVIINMAINAKDAMERGGTITVKAENVELRKDDCRDMTEARTGKFVLLKVNDTGSGMDRETLANIFEPFFTTKEFGKGTGLGLSVAYGIVKSHNGWIDVKSTPGKGTTFAIYLPVADRLSQRQALAGEETPGPTTGSPDEPPGDGERILLVEDEEVVRRTTEIVLGQKSYEVVEAATTKEALETFEREKGEFHLALVDVVLPDRSGIDLAEELVSIKPDLKIIMMSGYVDNTADMRRIRKRGFRFIEKPYKIPELLRAVKETIHISAAKGTHA